MSTTRLFLLIFALSLFPAFCLAEDKTESILLAHIQADAIIKLKNAQTELDESHPFLRAAGYAAGGPVANWAVTNTIDSFSLGLSKLAPLLNILPFVHIPDSEKIGDAAELICFILAVRELKNGYDLYQNVNKAQENLKALQQQQA